MLLGKKLIEKISTFPPEELAKLPNLTAWRVVGPVLLTHIATEMGDESGLHVYPSHYFIPRHYSGLEYSGNDKVYCKQYWGSTHTSDGKMGMEYGT